MTVPETQNREDTIAYMTFVNNMMHSKSKAECDLLRKMREEIIEGYEPEDLIRMTRNVIRMFWSTFDTLNKIMGRNPEEAWNEYCMSFAEQNSEKLGGDDNGNG
jgi:hypothetical protein